MTTTRRPSEAHSGRVRVAVVALESLENRTLLSGTAVYADHSTSATSGSTVEAAAATDVKTNNGHQFHLCHHLCWA
jgi:hypothetical protein